MLGTTTRVLRSYSPLCTLESLLATLEDYAGDQTQVGWLHARQVSWPAVLSCWPWWKVLTSGLHFLGDVKFWKWHRNQGSVVEKIKGPCKVCWEKCCMEPKPTSRQEDLWDKRPMSETWAFIKIQNCRSKHRVERLLDAWEGRLRNVGTKATTKLMSGPPESFPRKSH